MLAMVRQRVADALAAGQSLEEFVETKPTADLDPTWETGFIDGERFVGRARPDGVFQLRPAPARVPGAAA